MCDAIGHPVDQLKRVAIGPIRDSRLKLGHWRELTADEVERLRSGAQTQRADAARDAGPQRQTEDCRAVLGSC